MAQFLSGIFSGGYGTAAAAADLDASASFIYRPMGIDLRPLLLVPRLQPVLSTRGESVTRRSLISTWNGEFGEPSSLPDLLPPTVDLQSKLDSVPLNTWRAEQ